MRDPRPSSCSTSPASRRGSTRTSSSREGIEVVRAELDEGDPIPDLLEADLVVAMGGPMSVNDEAAHPWLADEKQRIAGAVRAGVPYFGVCLGAQLLAASLGATVRAGEVPEVGCCRWS